MNFFPTIPIATPKSLALAKLFGTKVVTESEDGVLTAYWWAGHMYITDYKENK